jgi:hypothetical protein
MLRLAFSMTLQIAPRIGPLPAQGAYEVAFWDAFAEPLTPGMGWFEGVVVALPFEDVDVVVLVGGSPGVVPGSAANAGATNPVRRSVMARTTAIRLLTWGWDTAPISVVESMRMIVGASSAGSLFAENDDEAEDRPGDHRHSTGATMLTGSFRVAGHPSTGVLEPAIEQATEEQDSGPGLRRPLEQGDCRRSTQTTAT